MVLGLLWCNTSFANLYELGKCYEKHHKSVQNGKLKKETYFSSWAEFNSDSAWDDITYTINPSEGIVTVSYIQNEEKYNESLKKFEKKTGKKFTGSRFHQRIYKILNYTEKLITAKVIENVGEFLIFIDLEKSKIDKEIKWPMGYTHSDKIVCEYTPIKTADEEGGSSQGSSGTAFFINNKGNLLTNHHVVDKCKVLKINYFDKEYEAQLIAKDKTLDLALLKADVRPKSHIKFSNYNPKKLQKIYVAGYPFGKGLSDDLKISSGIISSLKGAEDNSNELQIDAAINHGNSGGPIVGEGGELIGIAVSGLAKEVSEGINFGIKSSAALNFLGANDIDPSRVNRSSMNSDKLLKILEESTLYISCTY